MQHSTNTNSAETAVTQGEGRSTAAATHGDALLPDLELHRASRDHFVHNSARDVHCSAAKASSTRQRLQVGNRRQTATAHAPVTLLPTTIPEPGADRSHFVAMNTVGENWHVSFTLADAVAKIASATSTAAFMSADAKKAKTRKLVSGIE